MTANDPTRPHGQEGIVRQATISARVATTTTALGDMELDIHRTDDGIELEILKVGVSVWIPDADARHMAEIADPVVAGQQ